MTIALAAAPVKREAVLWLLCKPGENSVCSSYGSSNLLPASCALPTLCLTNNMPSEIKQDSWRSEQDQ